MVDSTLSPVPPSGKSMEETDREHLNLLKIFHYVVGALECCGCLFGLFYIVMGIILMTIPDAANGSADKEGGIIAGIFFIVLGVIFALIPLALGILSIISGKKIARRSSRTFSIVIAGINCAFFPFGTALGVFTIIVLIRDSVRRLYETEAQIRP